MAKAAKAQPDPALLPFRRERILAAGTLAGPRPDPARLRRLAPAGRPRSSTWPPSGLLLGFVRAGRIPCLADRWLNLAGLAYFALFWFGFRFGSRSLLKTALHILLFTTVLKLASIKRERDFSVALTLAAFLLVASMATSTHATILLFLAAYAAVAWPLFSRWALWRDLAAAPDEWRRDERAREIPSRRAVAASLAASLRPRRPDVHPPPAAEVVLHPGPSRRGHGGHRVLRHGRHEPLRPAPAERQGLPPGRRRGGAGERRPAVPEDPARGAHAVRRRGLEEARRPRARRRDARGVPPPAPASGERAPPSPSTGSPSRSPRSGSGSSPTR